MGNHTQFVAIGLLTTLAAGAHAQSMVAADLSSVPSYSTTGGGSATGDSSGIYASTAASGKYTKRSSANISADWIVSFSWTGVSNGAPMASCTYSLSLDDEADAESNCVLPNGSLDADASDNKVSASADVSGVGDDEDDPIDSTTFASGSDVSITMINVGGNNRAGSLNVAHSSLSSTTSLTDSSGMGNASSYGDAGAMTTVHSDHGSATVPPPPPASVDLGRKLVLRSGLRARC